ncbi:acyltransferase domain-containing protein [Piscinibacter aquaticus]|uniref:Acyltransferase domain-containing protein n=1 Tax=Piscinibacter aquaticus TaxID=392597 RepID=A0A5C6U0P1_9BURK|nr:acyltransferase domain-containing protein [Piscinibacter aquaticus]
MDRLPIAVIGIGCRFPGGVGDAASFWRLLSEGSDVIGEVPSDRFDLAHFYDERPATPGRVMSRWGGFLRDIDLFDAAFFGISPREAERLDPAQRLVLETAWEGLEDAGVDPLRLDGSRTGVFVGQWLSDFEARLFADPEVVDFYMTTGSGRYATSGRLSYLLGLRGPSLTLDTACSSSLVAVHQAVRSLRAGECDLALAGGVNVILQPHISVAYSQSRMMAPDGRCKFGDAEGDGYVRSEGAGMVVLKPLAAAQADGDRIYAVVRGSAVNNDGRSSGSMGTPSREGQEALLRRAYADAGVAPGEVGYIEAHGTGTRAGDPVELGALARVLGDGRRPGTRAWVGSVKTNLGHTEGAAGLAGFIKVALAIHHGRVPASLHCRQPNPAVDWSSAPLALARSAADWTAAPRFGGVSAFGIAGTNAHVVLESTAPVSSPAAAARPPARPALLVLSARSRAALALLARAMPRASKGSRASRWMPSAGLLPRAARRWSSARRSLPTMPSRCGHACWPTPKGRHRPSKARCTSPGPRAGADHARQGGQWPGMARELMDREPVFREALEACDAAARPWMEVSIVAQLRLDPSAPESRMDRIDFIQPALLAVGIGAARWLESIGVVPSALVGHSMGEVGAAHLAGVLDLGRPCASSADAVR